MRGSGHDYLVVQDLPCDDLLVNKDEGGEEKYFEDDVKVGAIDEPSVYQFHQPRIPGSDPQVSSTLVK